MADDAPERPEGPDRTDRRGTPPGAGTVLGQHGGRIGNPPFVPTEQQRLEVRTLAKVCSQAIIADVLGISIDTLTRHFGRELKVGKAEAVSTIGGKLLQKAMEGNLTAIIFYLRTQGKWNTRVEHVGADGGPIQTYDLSGFSLEQKRLLLPIIEAMMGDAAPGGEQDAGGERVH